MSQSADPVPPDPAEGETGRLRQEVARLNAEIQALRSYAASLEVLALEDPLTGLLNRRGFLRELGRAVAYRARYGTDIALLLVDLDRLKAVNDTYGHEAGDQALAHLGGVLRGSVRASDSIGRLGGDEFALILWNLAEAAAWNKAAALQRVLTESPMAYAGASLALSASIGVTAIQEDDTPDRALARADRAMYAQKATRP